MSADPSHRRPAPLLRPLGWLAAALALALVFSWYLSPHFIVEMAGRFWSCI